MKKIQDFQIWCKQNQALMNPKLFFKLQDDCQEYGVFTQENIKKGEWLYKIPRNMILGIDQVLETKIAQQAIEFAKQQNDDSCNSELIFWIYMCYGLYDTSCKWNGYLKQCPSQPQDIAQWDQDILQQLINTDLSYSIIKAEERLDKQLKFVKKLVNEYPEIYYPLEAFSDKNIRWAKGMYISRRFQGHLAIQNQNNHQYEHNTWYGGLMGSMVPLLDMTNHQQDRNTEFQLNDQDLIVSSLIDQEQNSEVFINYGDISNGQLLFGYGFCYPDNHYDFYTLQISQTNNQSSSSLGNFNISLKHGIPQDLWRVLTGETPDQVPNVGPDEIEMLLKIIKKKHKGHIKAEQQLLQKIGNIEQNQYIKIYKNGQLQILNQTIKELEQMLQDSDFYDDD